MEVNRLCRAGVLIKSPHKLVAYVVHKLSNYLKWLPDRLYISLMYFGTFGKLINLKHHDSMSFNEKLQWLKLYDRNPLYTELVDKYRFRAYIEENVGKEYLIPMLGVWDSADDIDFETLPDQFVLKCTHDSGSVSICRGKATYDVEKNKTELTKRLKRNLFWFGREWPYKNVKPRIIAEKYMEQGGDSPVNGLTDYKYFCINGKPEFLYISKGLEDNRTAVMSFYDTEGTRLPFKRQDYNNFARDEPLPPCFDEMTKLAGKCAKAVGVAFLRVDIYFIKDSIYISEFTFTPHNGLIPFDPPEWDQILGKSLKLAM